MPNKGSIARRLPRFAAAVGIVLLVVVIALLAWQQRSSPWAGAAGGVPRLFVAPTHADGVPATWSAEAFRESLATRLGADSTLAAQAGGGSQEKADYVLESDVTVEEGRAVIALRLRPAGQRAASWSATFWRHDVTEPTLPGDLALAVAEALGVRKRTGNTPHDPNR